MRMTLREVETIVSSAHTVFGKNTQVTLFGSRVDDKSRGGDIDLYVEMQAISQGVILDIENIKLLKYFNECDKHIQRIDEAYGDIESIIPLTVEKYRVLSKDEVQDIDQYIFRFSKLQDTMGDKIFRLILKKYEQSDHSVPFMDLLNKLEKYGCITSAKECSYLRKLRNEVAHQYDDEAEEMTQAINALLMQKVIIINIYSKLKVCSGVKL